MLKRFAIIIVVDIILKIILYGWGGFQFVNITKYTSHFVFLILIELIFFVPIYAFVTFLYVRIIKFWISKDEINKFISILSSVLYSIGIALIIFMMFFYNEWPRSQTIAYFLNSIAIGGLLWYLFARKYISNSPHS